MPNPDARLAQALDSLLELLWEMRTKRDGSPNAFYQLADRTFPLADQVAALLADVQIAQQQERDTLKAERDSWRRDFEAELEGNAALRKRFGAKDSETMFTFLERLTACGTPHPPATDQPEDPTGQGRLLLNSYGRQCYDKGREAASSTRETANHSQCHDLVCNGDRSQPRGTKGVTCSCKGRDTAYALLRELQVDLAAFVARETALRALVDGWRLEAMEQDDHTGRTACSIRARQLRTVADELAALLAAPPAETPHTP